jgi:hypothetical protein
MRIDEKAQDFLAIVSFTPQTNPAFAQRAAENRCQTEPQLGGN